MTNKMVLSISADSKTVKGEKFGYLTGILYLAPYTLSGVNLCPNAENAACYKGCLYSAGRGAFNNVQKARLAKTNRFLNDKENFYNDLIWSIKKVIRKAEKEGLKPCIRLNGTSDIVWQKEIIKDNKTIFELFPSCQFYDYTKIPQKTLFSNYHLTFSYSRASNKYVKSIEKAIDLGMSLAVVFKSNLPEIFLGKKVVNGDESDLRFLDEKGSIIGLVAKGKAKKDSSGFVVDETKIINLVNV